MKKIIAIAVGFCSVFGLAQAADYLTPRAVQAPKWISEVRFGVFDHDRWSPEKNSIDLNGEVLFSKFGSSQNKFVEFLIPRPHIGGTLNTGGRTSHAYAGFTWGADFYKNFFAEASFGGAVHNGDTTPGPKNNALGCNVLFRESASLGYRFTHSWSVMGTIEHLSNAGLCNYNRGLTNMGVRLGYSF